MVALAEILERHPVWRGGSLAQVIAALPSGFAALDAELPGGGWPRQALTELLAEEAGIGELKLILPAIAALTGSGRRTVWIAPPHIPYAPALAAAGGDLVNLLVVRAPQRRDALWAAEQALRSGSCHALAAWLPSPRYAELQRLAVAAEASHAAAFLFRPLAAAARGGRGGAMPRHFSFARLPPQTNRPPPRFVSRSSRRHPNSMCASSSDAARRSRARCASPWKDRSMLWVALHFPALPAAMLEPIAAWACQFTPKVALEAPDALLVEVEGSLRYFGGEPALMSALEGGLASMDVKTVIATAPTPRAALWRARGGGLPL